LNDNKQMVIYTYDIILIVAGTNAYKLNLSIQRWNEIHY